MSERFIELQRSRDEAAVEGVREALKAAKIRFRVRTSGSDPNLATTYGTVRGDTGGGIVGILVAWSLCTMKERTPQGEFYSFDEESRKKGRHMLWTDLVVLAIQGALGVYWFGGLWMFWGEESF